MGNMNAFHLPGKKVLSFVSQWFMMGTGGHWIVSTQGKRRVINQRTVYFMVTQFWGRDGRVGRSLNP